MSVLEANYNESINQSLDQVDDAKWQKLFPKCVVDFDKSSTFMKRAIYVAFSVILNRRRLLGSEYFSSNHITENLKCKTLSFRNPDSLRIANLLRHAGEAVQSTFLDEISLVVTNNEGDEEAIEVYSLKMHYFGEGGVAAEFNPSSKTQDLTPFERLSYHDYQGTKTVRDHLIWLVQSIKYLCEKVLGPLPQEFSANFRIKYTDDAPQSYRVEGFHDTSMFYTLPEDIQSATLGHLRPGHHAALATCMSNFIDDSFAAEVALKRYIEKVGEKMGYGVNETMYSTISQEDTTPPMITNTTTEGNNTGESLVKSMENLAASESPSKRSTRSQRHQESPNNERSARPSPYARSRTRK